MPKSIKLKGITTFYTDFRLSPNSVAMLKTLSGRGLLFFTLPVTACTLTSPKFKTSCKPLRRRELLEVSSIINLVEYFRNIYNFAVLFELRSIKIWSNMHTDTHPVNLNPNLQDKQNIPDDNKRDSAQFSTVLCFYSVCVFLLLHHVHTGKVTP